MGYLVHILLAVFALALPDLGWHSPWEFPPAVLALLLLPFVLGRAVRGVATRGRFRAAELLARLLAASASLGFVLLVGLCGWMESVQRWTGQHVTFLGWPQPALALALLPFVVCQVLAIHARSRALGSAAASTRWRNFQLRMFLSALAPMVIYFVAALLVGAIPDLRTRIEEVALYNAIFAALMLVLLGLCLPFLLRSTWETVPIPAGPLRALLEEVARRARFRARELLVWRTGNTMANAAIVGLGARTRVVLLSDLLLSQLDARELAAVFAHEVGHAARRHVLIFVLLAAGFFLSIDLVATELLGPSEWLAGGFVLAALAAGYVGFGWLSRRFELEADLYSLEVLHDPGALVSALEKVGGSFRDLASWRHFSTSKRVAFLLAAAEDPAVARRLVRVLRWAAAGALALFLVALSLQAWIALRRLPEDLVRADLRLGQYASAVERAHALEGLDPQLAGLLERAHELDGDEAPLERIERAAHAALERGDAEQAWQWLALGSLRGRDDLDVVAAVLRLRLEQPGFDVRGALGEELARSWGAELEHLRQ